MAGSAGRVELEVVAKVEQALSRLAALEAKVKALGGAGGATKITINVEEALARIEAVREKLSAFLAEAKTKGSIVLKADATAFVSAVTTAEKSVSASLDRIQKKAREADPLAALAVSATKEAGKVNAALDKLDSQVGKTFEKLKKRAFENFWGGLSDNAAKEASKLDAEFKKIDRTFQAAVNRLNQAARSANFDPTSASARRLADAVQVAAQSVVTFATKIQGSTTAASAQFQRLQAAAQQASVAVQQFGAQQTSIFAPLQALRDKLGTLTNAVQLFLASLVVQKVLDLGKAATDGAVKLELLRTALTGLLGSSKLADDQLTFLRKTADDFGVSFTELVERFRSFAPAATEAGLSLQATDDVFRSVALASRALGLSTEETQRALLAFQQILQKGKFQAEELTKQLGQLLPNALGILSRETGKSTEELFKLIKAGELSEDAVLALAAGMTEAFGPTAVGNAKATAAEIERFKNTLFDARVTIGNELLPALRDLLSSLQSLGTEGESSIQKIGKAFAFLIESAKNATNLIRDVFAGNFEAIAQDVQAFLVESFERLTRFLVDRVANTIGLVSDKLEASFRKAQDAGLDSISQLAKGYRGLADDARGDADKFEDSWVNAGKGIAAENEASAQRLRDAYKKTQEDAAAGAEKLTKKELAELKKREAGFEAFFTAISKLAQNSKTSPLPTLDAPALPEATGGGKSTKLTELQTQIKEVEKAAASLRTELATLEGQGIISGEEIGKARELRTQIGDLERQLESLKLVRAGEALAADIAAEGVAIEKAAAATQENAEKIRAALLDLVARNDDFRASFEQLEPAAQAAVIAIVSQLESVAKAGRVTSGDISEFGSRLLDVFTKSGAVSATFAAKLKAELGSIEGSAGSAETALRNLAASQQETSANTDALTAAAQKQAATLPTTTQTVSNLDAATGRLKISTEQVTAATQAEADLLQRIAGYFLQHQGALLTAQGAQDHFGVSLETVSGILRKAGVSVAEVDGKLSVLAGTADTAAGGGILRVGDQILKIGGKAEEAGKGLDAAGGKIGDLGGKELAPGPADSVQKLATAGKDAATGLKGAGDAAEVARTPIEAVGAAAQKVAAATIPPGLAEGLVGVGAAAKVAEAPLAAAAASIEKIGAGLEKVALVNPETITAIGTSFSGLAAPLAAAAAPADQLSTSFAAIAGAVTEIQGQLEPLTTSLTAAGVEIQAQVDAGAASALAAQLAELHTEAAKAAADFDTLATKAAALGESAAPIQEAVTQINAALEGLSLEKATTGFDKLSTAAGGAGAKIGAAATDQERWNVATEAGTTATGSLITKLGELATKIKGEVHSALAVTAAGDLKVFRKGFDDSKESIANVLVELDRLDKVGTPAINRAAAAAAELARNLQLALTAMRALNEEAAKAG